MADEHSVNGGSPRMMSFLFRGGRASTTVELSESEWNMFNTLPFDQAAELILSKDRDLGEGQRRRITETIRSGDYTVREAVEGGMEE